MCELCGAKNSPQAHGRAEELLRDLSTVVSSYFKSTPLAEACVGARRESPGL